MSRLPIRIRLTLAFAIAMALVLAATGLFLYLRLASGLDRTIEQGLRTRAADITALVSQSDTGLRQGRTGGVDTGVAQIVDTRGRIVDATVGVSRRLVPTAAQLRQARVHASFFTGTIAGEPFRVLAQPVNAQGKRLVVVVGTSLEPRTETLVDLRRQMLVGGPIALVLASLAGYLLAAAALRPVERMSERAATISAASPGRRLPVPKADDEIARLGGRLNEMLARLEGTLERERALVSNASHELRTPLSLMKTEIELALAEPESAPALAAALRSAAEETDRLAQLTDDLLLLARVDSGELPLRRTDFAARELLGTIATRYQRRVLDAGRTIEVVSPRDVLVRGDRRRLEQALANLVENSLRHGAGAIRLEAAEREGALELRVSDAGTGFPTEFVAHAFERFSRGNGSRETAGVGLGLAIVAAIAQAHSGTATASNDSAGGAEVTLRLPHAPALNAHGGEVDGRGVDESAIRTM
jgi:two-component system, OmpR family, sensor kinase